MKIFIGIFITVLCTIIGFFLSTKYSNKKKFYLDFYEFNNIIKREIKFTQKTIISLIENYKYDNSLFYSYMYKFFIEKNGQEIECDYIDENEKNFFLEYVKTIGTSDVYTQEKYLENINDYLKEKKQKSIDDEIKYKKLYIKLGFLIGLILFIIVI